MKSIKKYLLNYINKSSIINNDAQPNINTNTSKIPNEMYTTTDIGDINRLDNVGNRDAANPQNDNDDRDAVLDNVLLPFSRSAINKYPRLDNAYVDQPNKFNSDNRISNIVDDHVMKIFASKEEKFKYILNQCEDLLTLSAADDIPVKNFIKIMIAGVAADNSNHLPDTNKINEWKPEALKFVNKFKIDLPAFTKVCSLLTKKNETGLNEGLKTIGDSLNSQLKIAKQDPSIHLDDISYLSSLKTYFRTNSESSFNQITNKIARYGEHDLSGLFTKSVEDQSSHITKVRMLVKKLTGRNDNHLTYEECTKFNSYKDSKNPPAHALYLLYKEYLEHHRNAVNISKDHLKNLVRSSGQPYIDIDHARKSMENHGIKIHRLPPGFVGKIDENGDLYTKKLGLKIDGSPKFVTSVTMNPKYDENTNNTNVFKASAPGRAADGIFYTENFKKRSKTEKFGKVSDLIEHMDTFRNKWLKDLHSESSNNNIPAIILETVYKTSARIGSSINSMCDGNPTYGLTTLKCSHVRILQNGIKLVYRGKAGVEQEHVIKSEDNTSKKIIDTIKKLKEGKKPSDYLWTDNNGKRINSDNINKYLKSLGCDTHVHHLRHARGTTMAQEYLEDHPFKFDKTLTTQKKQAKADEYIKNMALTVGKELGHAKTKEGVQETVWQTAVGNYINPSILAKFYNSHELRVPKWLEKSLTEEGID